MDLETKRQQAFWALVLIIAIGLIGMMVVLWLMRTWKRHNERLFRRTPRADDDIPDMWRAGGDRLTAKMSPYPRPSAPQHPPDDESWRDEDEDGWADDDDSGWEPDSDPDDDDEPWRN